MTQQYSPVNINTQAPRISRTVSVDDSLTTDDDLVVVDSLAAPVTVTLFPATGNPGATLFIKVPNGATNMVTINPQAGESIDGLAFVTVSDDQAGVILKADSDAGNWNVLGAFPVGSSGGSAPLLALEGDLQANLNLPLTGLMGRPLGVGPFPPDGSFQACVISGLPTNAFGVPIPNNIARAQFALADVPVGTTFTATFFRKNTSGGPSANVVSGIVAAAAVASADDPTVVNVDLTISGTHGVDGDEDGFAVFLTETAGQMRTAFVGYFAVETGGIP